jgi:hypothetical protein
MDEIGVNPFLISEIGEIPMQFVPSPCQLPLFIDKR